VCKQHVCDPRPTFLVSHTLGSRSLRYSYDDVDLWARLRSLTIIKGLQFPPKLRAYLDFYEDVGDVPLYDVMAI
jgi:glutaredoxin 2